MYSPRISGKVKRFSPIASMFLLSLIAFVACREKDPVVPVGPLPTGQWYIALEDTTTIVVPQGGGNSDPIDVRLIEPGGSIATGKLLYFSCDFDVNHVTSSALSTDTTGQYPWGCNPALIYWGDGSDDQEQPIEMIHAYYVDLQTHDTLADTAVTYRIVQLP